MTRSGTWSAQPQDRTQRPATTAAQTRTLDRKK